MRRAVLAASLTAALTAGCHAPAPEPEPEGSAGAAGPIDYAGWPRLTKKPLPVARTAWTYCRGSAGDPAAEKEAARLGPHFVPAIVVYANPTADAGLRAGDATLPAGSVIVKEKVSGGSPDQPFGYAAMIKREPGYDPERGDWEYLYAGPGGDGQVERGKLETCIACHAGQAKQDFLFLTYKKAEKP